MVVVIVGQDVLSQLYNEKGEITSDHFTLAIKAAAIAEDYPMAARVWKLMLAADCKPTVHSYAGIISAAMSAKQYKVAYAYFNR
jgi:hypothetical protein